MHGETGLLVIGLIGVQTRPFLREIVDAIDQAARSFFVKLGRRLCKRRPALSLILSSAQRDQP